MNPDDPYYDDWAEAMDAAFADIDTYKDEYPDHPDGYSSDDDVDLTAIRDKDPVFEVGRHLVDLIEEFLEVGGTTPELLRLVAEVLE